MSSYVMLNNRSVAPMGYIGQAHRGYSSRQHHDNEDEINLEHNHTAIVELMSYRPLKRFRCKRASSASLGPTLSKSRVSRISRMYSALMAQGKARFPSARHSRLTTGRHGETGKMVLLLVGYVRLDGNEIYLKY